MIERLPPPWDAKALKSFLGHTGFYMRFIKDVLKIARPLSNLLAKDVPFHLNRDNLKAFKLLKGKLVTTPIIIARKWDQEFKLMYDASDYAVGAVLE